MKILPTNQGQSLNNLKAPNQQIVYKKFELPTIPVHLSLFPYALVHLLSSVYLSRSTVSQTPISVNVPLPVHDHARRSCLDNSDKFSKYTGLCGCLQEDPTQPIETNIVSNYLSVNDSAFQTTLASIQHRVKSEVERVYLQRHTTGPRRKLVVYSELHAKPELTPMLRPQNAAPTNTSTPTAGLVSSLGAYIPSKDAITGFSSYLTGWGASKPTPVVEQAPIVEYSLDQSTNEQFRTRLEVSVALPEQQEQWTLRFIVSDTIGRSTTLPSSSQTHNSQLQVEQYAVFVPSSAWNVGKPILHQSLLNVQNESHTTYVRNLACKECRSSPSIEYFTEIMRLLDQATLIIANTAPHNEVNNTNSKHKLVLENVQVLLETEYDATSLVSSQRPPDVPPLLNMPTASIHTTIKLDSLSNNY